MPTIASRLLCRVLPAASLFALVVTSALVPGAAVPAGADPGDTTRGSGSGDDRVLVETDNGTLRGKATDEGVAFLGVPYGRTTKGDWRLRKPRPATPWQGVRDAHTYGHRCAQNTYWAPGFKKRRTTEDCLDVNIYVPPSAGKRRLPVMVWIHGGANIGGSGRDIVPDAFAQRTDTVVVSINYRLGAFGFLALPGTSGNFALLDQRLALTWVQDNIDAFGGDPDRVTIAGESAGGSAVCAQLASPRSVGLFRSAIIQSGAFGNCAGTPRRLARERALEFAARAGCAQPKTALRCMRSKSAKTILEAQVGTGPSQWNYTIGGQDLPEQPADAFAAGIGSDVPVINGANSNEGLVFAYDTFDRWGDQLTAEEYPAALVDAFGEDQGARVLEEYPLSAYERPSYAYAAAFGDFLFACPAMQVNAPLTERGKVYAYEFADRTSPLFASLPQDADFDFGATHAAELNYLFKPYGRSARFNAEQRALSLQMMDYWGSFIHGSRPRVAGQPAMPLVGGDGSGILQLRTASAGGNAVTTDLPAQHHCGLWSEGD